MGAMTFTEKSSGKSAGAAFSAAVAQAQWEHGHGGYSGTLAEKHDYVVIPSPKDKDPIEYAQELMDESDERINNKWGPAGCIALPNDEYLFFGWASS